MGRRLQKEMSLHVVADAAVPGPDDLCDGREVHSPLTVRKAEEGSGQVQARNVNVSRVWTRILMPVDRRRFESIQQRERCLPHACRELLTHVYVAESSLTDIAP